MNPFPGHYFKIMNISSPDGSPILFTSAASSISPAMGKNYCHLSSFGTMASLFLLKFTIDISTGTTTSFHFLTSWHIICDKLNYFFLKVIMYLPVWFWQKILWISKKTKHYVQVKLISAFNNKHFNALKYSRYSI